MVRLWYAAGLFASCTPVAEEDDTLDATLDRYLTANEVLDGAEISAAS